MKPPPFTGVQAHYLTEMPCGGFVCCINELANIVDGLGLWVMIGFPHDVPRFWRDDCAPTWSYGPLVPMI
jgi:hypothetical protein